MKLSSIVVVDIPIGGSTATTSVIRESAVDPGNPLLHEGWELSEEIAGVICVKGPRCILVPWGRVVMAEVANEPKKGSKP